MLKDNIQKMFEGFGRSNVDLYLNRFFEAWQGAKEEGIPHAYDYAKDETAEFYKSLTQAEKLIVDKKLKSYDESYGEPKEDDLSGRATIRIQGKDF